MLYLISNIVEFADCQTACIHSILNVETVIFNQTTICASDYVSRTVSIEEVSDITHRLFLQLLSPG